MADKTGIQWTDATWSVVTGCERCSPGCAHCYAEALTATRLSCSPKYKGLAVITPTGEPHWTGEIRLHPDELSKPLRWKKPRMIFVNSMSDTFHEDVPRAFIRQILDVAVQAGYQHGHTFQFLTKRAERMRDEVGAWVSEGGLCGAGGFCPENHPGGHKMPPFLWLGVSVEDQQRADERIPVLLQTPAAVRFLSCEPLLGPINLSQACPEFNRDAFPCDALDIDWVIVGGESGDKARPCHVAHVRSLVAQCKAAGVACFVKQLGSNVIDHDTTSATTFPEEQCWPRDTKTDYHRVLLRDRKGGAMEEWPEDLRVRELPTAAADEPCKA